MTESVHEEREGTSAQVFRSRGVFYFTGRVRCPLAGVGERGDYEGNRLALDDTDTEVTLDRSAGRITVRNSRTYERKTTVCDLLFLAEGLTASGSRKPFSIHLKIRKSGTKFSLDLHRHLRTQDPIVSAEFEPFEVIATDGTTSQVVFNKARGDQLCRAPSLALRIVKALMAMRNHLDGVTQDPRAPGFRIADLSVGFGALGLEWMMARAELASLGSGNAELIQAGSVAEMLGHGAWELKLSSFSDRWLPEVVQRDLFLFGLDELPLLEDVRAHGLRKGQTLAFRFEKGSGEVVFEGRSEPLANTLDLARAYLEFHMLGGLLAEHAEDLSRSLRKS